MQSKQSLTPTCTLSECSPTHHSGKPPSSEPLRQFEFVVPGDCVPWARAGGGKSGHRFTPPKQAKYMAALKIICQAAMKGAPPFDCAVRLELVATYSWPKMSKAARAKAEANGGWRTGRPDLDNLAKIVGDALNGIAWVDDAQIATGFAKKIYGDMPGLRVRVGALG